MAMSDDTKNVIATDHPLSSQQQQNLSALLDAMLPASDDGAMPSAGELDLISYLHATEGDFVPALQALLDLLDEGFALLSYAERYEILQGVSSTQTELFEGLLFHVYSCYYQQDSVLAGLGLATGPPFPRGNTVDAGDLSLLDPVIELSKTYRK